MNGIENIKPVLTRVLVKRYEKEYGAVNHQGKKIQLILPEAAKQEVKKAQGEVISVGGQVTEVKPGEKIIFGRYSGFDLKSSDGQYTVMEEADVVGILGGGYIDE